MSKPILSVIIVSWNVRNLLRDCLQSIFTSAQDIVFEVIVVDNNSSDGTVSMVERDWPLVKLIANPINRGFAQACQQGVSQAQGKYFLFLNDDTVVLDHTFDKSVSYFEKYAPSEFLPDLETNAPPSFPYLNKKNTPPLFTSLNKENIPSSFSPLIEGDIPSLFPPLNKGGTKWGYNYSPADRKKIGVLGCRILNSDGSQQTSVRSFPNLHCFIILLLKLHNIFPWLLNNYLLENFDYETTQEVDQVMGSYFLTARQVWDKLNGFDEKFYIWFEEVDYCMRVKQAGFKVIYYSDAKIKHYGGASFKQLKAIKEQLIFNNSLLYFAKKHFPSWQVYVLYLFIPVNIFLTTLVLLLDNLGINPKS